MELLPFEKLKQAVAEALAAQKAPIPFTQDAKDEIRRRLFRMMRVKEEWLPTIKWECVRTESHSDVETETLFFRSWEGVYGYATLYMPAKRNGKVPAMMFSPGHAMQQGRFQNNYQLMAQLLASHGVAVLLFDQFGLGERAFTGHYTYGPFSCGTTVIGLMILEGIALFNALSSDERIDASRVGIMGHSGGGQNTIFLSAALQSRAALSVTSGWACSFEYTALKERRLCPCDIFPGILHEFEIWHALACIYPNPIMCCSGMGDSMIARDVVLQLAHRFNAFYPKEKFEVYLWDGGHKWNAPGDFAHVADFVLRNMGLAEYGDSLKELPEAYFPEIPSAPEYPADAIDMNQLAARLTGNALGSYTSIRDVFPQPGFLTQQEFESLDDEAKEIFTQISAFL